MKNTIIFLADVDNTESYGLLANFIYKREHHLNLADLELQHITYKYYLKNSYQKYQDWAWIITRDRKSFEPVREPQKIKNITAQYEVIYCLSVGPSTDLVDIHNLYLIRHYYAKLKIVILFDSCNKDRYHAISQFLYHVNCADQSFYESCYFKSENLKKAQMENIQFSRKFIPLQIVNQDSLGRLFRNSNEFLDETYIHEILTEEKLGNLRKAGDDLLEGAIKLLHNVRANLSGIPERRLMRVFERTDIFSFILLCYVVCTKKNTFRIETLERYAYEMQQYSAAIRQLAENIVFHSGAGFGIIAFRVHDSSSDYMEKQYHIPKEKQGCNFLEVIVSDFYGDGGTKNIAENFVQKIEDVSLQSKFARLRPVSFFMHEEGDVESAWEHFYLNPDHIGKHFGLRIFQSIVTSFHGLFGAESHSRYLNQLGDEYLSYKGVPHKHCMPGTRYHIVFPIKQNQKDEKKQDLSLDSGIGISANIRTILGYCTDDLAIICNHQEFQSQDYKNRKIIELSAKLQEGLEHSNCDIVYSSIDNISEGMGEVLSKALVMALFRLKRNIRVVLFQCSAGMKKSIFNTIRIFFHCTDMESMFFGKQCQIILYSNNFEELVLDLGSGRNTDNINAYISHIKCIASAEWTVYGKSIDLSRGAENYIPCDVLREVIIAGKKQTLFEHYTEMILERNIQEHNFGCKFEHTHMRLSSAIHIENFYEAELLFGNKLFVSRFALLLVKDMLADIRDIEKLTLYGYGTYSETVLVQMREMILTFYPQKKDVDYIILEREEERRGFLHKDRIRYNRLFASDEDRIEYFADRKLAIVVLINSTLKTHIRLISLFRDENEKTQNFDKDWLIRNYAVILIGSIQGNKYWELAEEKKIKLSNEKILPAPKYFIQLQVDYQEPMDCDYCFPSNPMVETPLIEVNAASTIPNQAYGIVTHFDLAQLKLDDKLIQEEDKLKRLKGNFLYGHVQRNENHFLYYFKTENIWVREQKEIENSLKHWCDNCVRKEAIQYNILVAPMHYSNAGFVELVNNIVFQGNAILLRVDFDKEYRSNAYTKFSYLRNYVNQLRSMDTSGVLSIHFVDDSIISGRTFHRAKSLLESILEVGHTAANSLEIRLFDKVFVLIDRNSAASRTQYVKNYETDFYYFFHINISSLRNYGDSCTFCNLKKEADLLCETASTAPVAEYWEHYAEKFQLLSLEEYDKKQKEKQKNGLLPDNDRAFRRLFCAHIAQCVLAEKYHGNSQAQTIYLILKLINTDYTFRSTDKYEYFLSYLKCISRPFLVFQKSVKEAIFDILLLLADAVVRNKKLRTVIKEVEDEKIYLKEQRLIRQFNLLDNILHDPKLSETNKQDLVKLLMKQLTELKSNYIIRPEKMSAIFAFMKNVDQEKFELYYITLICRLVGASSDTNKSVWLDDQIWKSDAPLCFKTWVSLENTRTFRDGIEKFYIKWNLSEEFRRLSEERLTSLKVFNDLQIAERMFDDYITKNKMDLEEYEKFEDSDQEAAYNMSVSIQRFLQSLPKFKNVDFSCEAKALRNNGLSWSRILEREKKELKKEKKFWERLDREREQEEYKEEKSNLQEIINQEPDVYQYSNFYKILQRDGYIDGGNVSQDGIDLIICCMKVLELCRDSDLPILSKVQELTMLFKVILGAQSIYFMVENKAENNLDEWKDKIENRFNQLAGKWIEKNGRLALHIKANKHYAIIREKTEAVDYDQKLSMETEKLLACMECEKSKQHNYIIDRKAGIVIWKLANQERSIWVSIEKVEWRSNKENHEIKIGQDLRKVMMFYQELRQKIFNPENDDYMNEISHIRRELNIYNSNRVYTHTKDFSQKEQFEQVLHFFSENNNQKKDTDCYPFYVLKLLSDMVVSKYYRRGLKKIQDEVEMKQLADWANFSPLLKDGRVFLYHFDNDEKLSVELKASGIDETEKVLCRKDNKDAIRELTLLIYALVLNAAEKNRGKRQERSSAQQQEARVIVYLSKEENFLVIGNECEKPVDIEQIKHKLNQVPESEEEGISLWSMNCYIKRCINALIMATLKEIEASVAKNQANKDQLWQLKNWIEKLIGEEFAIQPAMYEREGKTFFQMKVPIFMSNHYFNTNKNGERRAK